MILTAVAQKIWKPPRPPRLAEGLGCNGLVNSCYNFFHGDVYFRTCWVHHLRESSSMCFVALPNQLFFWRGRGGRIRPNARTRSRKCTFKKRHKLNSQGSGKAPLFKRVSQTVPNVFGASVDEATADSAPKRFGGPACAEKKEFAHAQRIPAWRSSCMLLIGQST